MRELSIEEIRLIFNRIIKKLTDEEVTNVILEDDLYRFIPTEKWNSYEDNIVLEGSLYDDIDSLKLLIENPERYCTYVDFDRLAFVLRAISEKKSPVNG